jgi:hypothetical protein
LDNSFWYDDFISVWRYENLNLGSPILCHLGKLLKFHFGIYHNTPDTVSIFVTIAKRTGNNRICPTFDKTRDVWIYIVISNRKNDFFCLNRCFIVSCDGKDSVFFLVDIYYLFLAKFSRIVFVDLFPCNIPLFDNLDILKRVS